MKSERKPTRSYFCRNNAHGHCGGKRYVGSDKQGRPTYGRCQCDCHKAGGWR